MSKVLVTGGAGYIGSHAVYALLDAGYEVVVVDNLSTGRRENLTKTIEFHQVDVQNEAAVADILKKARPDAVMHFAGSVIVPESVADPLKYYENNTLASLSLIRNCVAHNIHRFIFSSTAAVYGIPAEEGMVSEVAPCSPINPYGQSKLMTERILEDTALAHPEFCYAALRYFNVAGADLKGRTGQSTPEATHLIKVACQAALGVREKMVIFGDDYDTPDGSCIRDYIDVCDLARAHLAALDYLERAEESLVMNCGNGRGYSVKEVVETVRAVSGRDFQIEIAGRRPGDPPVLIAKANLIGDLTGWVAQRTDLSDIVAAAYAWEKRLLSDGSEVRVKKSS